jgi:hypothetical protein
VGPDAWFAELAECKSRVFVHENEVVKSLCDHAAAAVADARRDMGGVAVGRTDVRAQ